MRKFFVFLVTVVMVASCMIVPAFAADYNGIDVPDFQTLWEDKETHANAMIFPSGDSYNVVFANSFEAMSGVDGVMIHSPCVSYSLLSSGTWYKQEEVKEAGQMRFVMNRPIWSHSPIYYESSDEIYFQNPIATDSAVLPSVVSGGSLVGVLGEVISLLIWVIPAVIGFFAVRKGVAFLIARIRGV